jgi:hypothetical protein
MVLLDQHPVVEAGTVVPAASAADGVLLERAQAGSRLAGVQDGRAGPVRELDEAAGE